MSKYTDRTSDGNNVGETWAIALSEDGQYLASTSVDGRVNVWDNFANCAKIREFETKGSFGMSIDLVWLYLFSFLFLQVEVTLVVRRKIYSIGT